MEKLRRAKHNKKIAGVCQGIANALKIDASYVRLIWMVLAIVPPIATTTMVLIYIALAVILPEEKDYYDI